MANNNNNGDKSAAAAINGGEAPRLDLDSLSIDDDKEADTYDDEEAGTYDEEEADTYDDEEADTYDDEEAGTCIHGDGDSFLSWLHEYRKEVAVYYSMYMKHIWGSSALLASGKAIPYDENNNNDDDDDDDVAG